MHSDRFAYNRGAVRPLACLREGWQLIKDDYWLFLGICFVGALVGGMGPFGILLGPTMCGIHLCLLRREHGLSVSFSMLFNGFEYFLQSFIATLFMVVPMIVLMIALYVLFAVAFFGLIAAQGPQQRNAPPGDAFFVALFSMYGVFILAIVSISLTMQLLFFFIYPLIVDRELSGVEAVKLSIRAAFGNFFGLVGLLLLTTALSFVGLLACYVGAIFFNSSRFLARRGHAVVPFDHLVGVRGLDGGGAGSRPSAERRSEGCGNGQEAQQPRFRRACCR
jgi:hypothetical protein